MTKSRTGDQPDLQMVNPNAAAIDIGSTMHMAAVNPDTDAMPVRAFGTFTQDLHDLADWFRSCGVTSVAMESTGVYWIPAFEVLEAHGFEVILVNARYAKNVPGRKTDVSDAGWLRQLHSYGLLRGSFRPEAEIATLRAYMRQRERLTEYAAAHIQHMQKALMEMNLQLHHVVSDITGATGMRIIRAIVGGERDPEVLAAFRDVRYKCSMDTIKAALVGNDRDEHVFALTQSLELYDFYKVQIEAFDRKLEAAVGALTVRADNDLAPLPKARVKGKQHNSPSFDVRAALYGVLGTDLTQIHGLGSSLALKLVAECGTDLRAWKSAKHFTSWLCLAPGNKISGGKLLASRTRRSSCRAAALLRLAAVTIGRSDTALGAFYRRLSSRIGKQKAVTATARKIAVLFYNAIRHGMTYQDQGAAAYDERHSATSALQPSTARQDTGLRLGAHARGTGCFLGRLRLTSRGKRHDVRVRRETSAYLAGQLDVRRAGRLPVWLPCLAQTTDQRPGELRREARRGDRQELQGQRSHLWRPPGLARRARGRAGLRAAPDERLMRQNAMRARPKRRGTPKDDGARSVIADNILDRDLQADRPNQKWPADFTYIWTAEGWLYVSVVLDLFPRRVVGWSMKADRDASLVMDALMMAVWRRGKTDALLHHSDQGSQYTSEQFQRLLLDNGITCSMSRAGNVWDNSAMESFFSSLKTERTARKVYRTRDAARADVFDYIERFYNPRRRHSTLGYLSPMAFEDRAMQT